MPEEVVVLKDIVKSFNGQRVLDGVSLTVNAGEYMTIIGESSAGKSVLLRIIVGLLKPDSGEVHVLGRDVVKLNEKGRRQLMKDVEMQFQSGALFDSMTVGDNIKFILDEEKSMKEKEKRAIIDELLGNVNLRASINKFPFELSGGMQKRVAVVRALATSPKLALFDEPAAGLDPVTSVRIVKVIKDLVAENEMTIIVSTTSVHLAKRFSDRFVLLREGRIHVDGTWDDQLENGDEYTRHFLERDLKAQG